MATVLKLEGKGGKVSKTSVDETVFGDRILAKTLREALLMYQADARQGSASTKERGEIAGSTIKPWKQKHTGRARAGSKKSPIWRGGGTVFGPHPRDFGWNMPRKALKGALRSALLGKLRDEEVSMISGLKFDKPSSKDARGILKSLEVKGSCCVVLNEPDPQVWKSFRNFPGVSVKVAKDLNAFDVCFHQRILFVDGAFEFVQSKVGGPAAARPAAKKKAAPRKAAAPKMAKKPRAAKKKGKE